MRDSQAQLAHDPLAGSTFRTGLERKPSMPACRHSSRSWSDALAVIATMGTSIPSSRMFYTDAERASPFARSPISVVPHAREVRSLAREGNWRTSHTTNYTKKPTLLAMMLPIT